ncbi:MAG: hypothetical protein RIG62_26550 [Cyclobacteriaceae bacterium]
MLPIINKIKKRLLFISIAFLGLSCQQASKPVSHVAAAKEYIQVLNESDYEGVISLFKDSIRMKELVYSSVFSREEYYQLFQWDSVFHPTYQILDIKEENDGVRMTVSKECTRIRFLNEAPNVTDERLTFEQGKITHVEILNYIVFNEATWEKNRADLVQWVEREHPALDGFLYDQTKKGALKYLKAINLYQESKDQP